MSGCNCVTNALVGFNAKVEQFFYKLGGVIATYPLISISFTLLFFGGFGFGLIDSHSENDLYALWIDQGSRLIKEREFTAEHFPFDSRIEFLMASTTDYGGTNMITEDTLEEWLELTKTIIDVNVTYKGDPTGAFAGENVYAWADVCSRYRTPLLLRPLFSTTGNELLQPPGQWTNLPEMRGFPCTRYTVMDCFKEGNYEYGITSPMSQLLSDPYADLPSFRGQSPEKLLEIISPSCLAWSGVLVPWNNLYGDSPRVNESDVISNVTRVGTLQMVAFVKGSGQFAVDWKRETCVAKAEAQQLLNMARLNAANQPGVVQLGNCALDTAYCLSSIGRSNVSNPTNGYYQLDCLQQGNKCLNDAIQAAQTSCSQLCQTNPGTAAAVADGQCLIAIGSSLAYPNPFTQLLANPPACITAGAWDTTDIPMAPPGTTYWLGVAGTFGQTLQGCQALGDDCQSDLLSTCLGAGYACFANEIAGCMDAPTDAEESDADNIINAWELAFADKFQEVFDSNKYDFYVDFFPERATDDLVAAAGDADLSLIVIGYLCMFIYTGLSFMQCNTLESRFLTGIFGVFIMVISVVSTLGLTALSGSPLSPTIVQVLPFVGLGLGVSDIFVLGGTYKYRPGWTYAEMAGVMLAYAGPSVSLTCLTNFFAFLVGYFVPLPAINQFAYSAMIGVATNYFIAIIGFTAILTLDAKRIRANRMDCCCCFRTRMDESKIRPNEGNSEGFWRKWADCTLSLPGKIIIIVLAIVVFAVAMAGAVKVDVGLPLADIVPKAHYSHHFLKQREAWYGGGQGSIVIGMARDGTPQNVDFTQPDILTAILNMERRFESVSGYSPTVPVRVSSGIDSFLTWVNSKGSLTGAPNAAAYQLSTEHNYTFPYFSPEFPSYTIQLPYPEYFMPLLNSYLADPTASGISLYTQFEVVDNNVKTVSLDFIEENLFSLDQIVEHIKATRVITDSSGLPAYPSGLFYNLYEQYLNVRRYCSEQLGYVTIAVALCLFTFIYNPIGVCILLFVIALITAEVYGYLYWFGLKLNGVSVVNLIMSVGLSVEFTAHFARFFMVFTGTRNQRANQSLRLIVFPVINATLTTFIGVFPMAFAKFPYFTLYFFYQYVIILVAGFYNGVFLLPVLLSLIGPATLSAESNKGSDKTVETV